VKELERRRVKKYSAPGGFFLKATILPPFRYASFYLLCVCSASLFAEFQADDEFFSLSRERGKESFSSGIFKKSM
jgi:hypothetical protein